MATGRFAPSPTGALHVGNLRTAVLAWLYARAAGSPFLLRIEDLDPVASSEDHVRSHLADLRALGLDWDGEVVRQSARFDRYEGHLARLDADGDLYPCWCSRREVAAAAQAPHADLPEGAYPGTCRDLTPAERAVRASRAAGTGRGAAWRVRAGGATVAFDDRVAGRHEAVVDDFVVRRVDGVPAYQLAVVVDDDDQGVGEVVRGDDLLSSTPRQLWLARRLGLRAPSHAHVPLVHGPDGRRLAKRHGATTLAELAAAGVTPPVVLGAMASSLGLAEPHEPVPAATLLVDRFAAVADALPRTPWTFDVAALAPGDTHGGAAVADGRWRR